MIHDIPTCEDLVSRIEKEALDTLKTVNNLIVDQQPEPDVVGKQIGETSDPRKDGASVAKAKL